MNVKHACLYTLLIQKSSLRCSVHTFLCKSIKFFYPFQFIFVCSKLVTLELHTPLKRSCKWKWVYF